MRLGFEVPSVKYVHDVKPSDIVITEQLLKGSQGQYFSSFNTLKVRFLKNQESYNDEQKLA